MTSGPSTGVLPPSVRVSTIVAGAANLLLGVVLFFAPAWSAGHFPWAVTAFMAMTIGGYALGNAWTAWLVVARARTWTRSFPTLVYLWVFGAGEVAVVVWFRNVFTTSVTLAWPYLATVAVTAAAAVIGLVALVRGRPTLRSQDEQPSPRWLRALIVAFVVFVGFLAVVAIAKPHAGATLTIFPEVLTPFTIRVFGMFYLALALGAVAAWWVGRVRATLTLLEAGIGIVVPTVLAAFVYFGRFDISAHPGQLVYIGSYLLVLAVALVVVALTRPRGTARAAADR